MKHLAAEWYYLMLAMTAGIACVLLTPPGQVPDEHAHFLRSYQTSEGRIVGFKQGDSTGSELPVTVSLFMSRYDGIPFQRQNKTSVTFIRETGAMSIHDGERIFIGYANTAIHPPLAYIPQGLGIFLTRQFTSSLLPMLYGGRLANLIAASLVTFLAIRRTPVAKWLFVVLGLAPMNLFMSASLSSDALTNAMAFLLVAQVLNCVFGSEAIVTNAALIRLTALGIAIGQCKQAYFLLPACYLLIPFDRMGSPRRYLLGFMLVMGATLLSVAAWGLVVRSIYTPANPAAGIDPGNQLGMMWHEPQWFFAAVRGAIENSEQLLRQYTGVLGWLDTDLPKFVIVAELSIMLIMAIGDPQLKLRGWQVATAMGVAAVVALTVTAIIYMTWERVGATSVGLQGRYFIPIGPLVWIAASQLRPLLSDKGTKTVEIAATVAIAAIPCLLIQSLLNIQDRYYVNL